MSDSAPAPSPPIDPSLVRLAGVNRFLREVRGIGVRLSDLLSQGGFSAEEIRALREAHLARFLDLAVFGIRCVCQRYRGGKRMAEVLCDRFQLEPPPPAAATGGIGPPRATRAEEIVQRQRARRLIGGSRGWRHLVAVLVLAGEATLGIRKPPVESTRAGAEEEDEELA
ncbi:MAG: hypothetical protein HZA54_05720 [Planctomycetes bacterium]|nr:hypothetical protein [Planctomycetota bacterium]